MAKISVGLTPYDLAVSEFVKRMGAEPFPENMIVSYSTQVEPRDLRTVTITFVMDEQLANFGAPPEPTPEASAG